MGNVAKCPRGSQNILWLVGGRRIRLLQTSGYLLLRNNVLLLLYIEECLCKSLCNPTLLYSAQSVSIMFPRMCFPKISLVFPAAQDL